VRHCLNITLHHAQSRIRNVLATIAAYAAELERLHGEERSFPPALQKLSFLEKLSEAEEIIGLDYSELWQAFSSPTMAVTKQNGRWLTSRK
jgi:hypothetical protein